MDAQDVRPTRQRKGRGGEAAAEPPIRMRGIVVQLAVGVVLVLAAFALVVSAVAAKFFRWETT